MRSCQRPGIQIGGTCCSVAQIAATGACSNSSCQSGQTPIGPSNFCCNNGQVYNGGGGPACCSGQVVNGQCQQPPTPPSRRIAAPRAMCRSVALLPGQQVTSTGICCPAGQTPSGANKSQCEKIRLIPIGPRCCASGIPTASGKCCPPANVTTGGVCCPDPVDPQHRQACKVLIPLTGLRGGLYENAGRLLLQQPLCRPGRKVLQLCRSRARRGNSATSAASAYRSRRRRVRPGEFRESTGACEPIPSSSCPPDNSATATAMRADPLPACPRGKVRDNRGKFCAPNRCRRVIRSGRYLRRRADSGRHHSAPRVDFPGRPPAQGLVPDRLAANAKL